MESGVVWRLAGFLCERARRILGKAELQVTPEQALRVMVGLELVRGEQREEVFGGVERGGGNERHDLNSANELKLRFFGHPRRMPSE